jgi:CHC2 zinc finger
MANGHFQPELLPPARSFYEKELGKLTRPSRGWARGNCPFHESKSRASFSVNLDSGGFYCFGCEAKGGDILDFVKLRDRVDFKRAAQLLGAWRDQDMSLAEKEEIHRVQQERERQQLEQAAQKESERQKLMEARDWLHTTVKLYAEAKASHDWELMALLLPEVRDAEEAYCLLAGLEVSHDW